MANNSYTNYLNSSNTPFPQGVNQQRSRTSPTIPSFVPETQPGHHPPQLHENDEDNVEDAEDNDEENAEENAEGLSHEEVERCNQMTLEELLVSPARKKLTRLEPNPIGKALW